MMALSKGAVWPATLPVASPRFSRCLGGSARCLAPQPRSHLSWSDPASRRGGVAAPWRRVPPARLPLPAAAPPRPAAALLDAVPGKGELLSPRLDADVRQRAENAIELRGGRVTIGDVASTAGLRLNQAEEAVRALAADSQATLKVGAAYTQGSERDVGRTAALPPGRLLFSTLLSGSRRWEAQRPAPAPMLTSCPVRPGNLIQVTEDGEIVWEFARDFQDTIRSKSLLLRLEPAAKGALAPGGSGHGQPGGRYRCCWWSPGGAPPGEGEHLGPRRCIRPSRAGGSCCCS